MFRNSRYLINVCTIALALLMVVGLASPTRAAIGEPVFVMGINEIFFNNFENLFDSTGAFKPLGSTIVEGDHFMGILRVQNIDQAGLTHWNSTSDDQLTGIFAQRVEAVVSPDPFDATQIQNPHIVLGAPTISLFTMGLDVVDTSPYLVGAEMIALFRQSGPGTTPFESNGTMLDDVTKATDGSKFLSFSYAPGADGIYGEDPATAADDSGYWYSHAPDVTDVNIEGATFLGLDLVFNASGFILADDLNDINEGEVGTGKLNHLVGSGEIEGNPRFPATSPWAFASNDPVLVHIIPEPVSILTWAGLVVAVGLGAAVKARRRSA